MRTYAESKLDDRVLVLSDMASMVKCVEKLPDLTEDSEGWVCQLIGTQPGYTATHIYKCVKNEDEELVWEDITSSTEISASGLETPKFKRVEYSDGNLRIIVIWTQPEPETATDVWERDVLIRKLDNFPETPIDGEVLTNDIDINADQRCVYVSNFLNNPSGNYKYRIFHLYKSGKTTYTDVGSNDPTKSEMNWEDIKYLVACGVASKIFTVGDTFSVKGQRLPSDSITWTLKISNITDPVRSGSVVTGGKMVLMTYMTAASSWYMTASISDIRATIDPDFLEIFTVASDLVLTRTYSGTAPSMKATITNV